MSSVKGIQRASLVSPSMLADAGQRDSIGLMPAHVECRVVEVELPRLHGANIALHRPGKPLTGPAGPPQYAARKSSRSIEPSC